MTKTERAALVAAVRAAQDKNIIDRLLTLEAAVLRLLAE